MIKDCQDVNQQFQKKRTPKDKQINEESSICSNRIEKCLTDAFSSYESDSYSSPESYEKESLAIKSQEITLDDNDFFNSDVSSDGSLLDCTYSESDNDLSDHDIIENNSNNIEDTKDKKDTTLINKLRFWALKFRITLVALTALLLIFRTFTEHVLPLDARTLLGTEKYTNIVEMDGGEYLHLGLERAIRSILRENKGKGITRRNIKLAVNIDGVPIYTSCKESLWTILCSEINSKEVYPVGIYCGRNKPHDANKFLNEFVDEAIGLINCGLTDEDVTISFEALICDTPAKAFALYLKGHTGYDSCSKCNISGTYVIIKKKTKNSKQTGQVCFPGTGPFTLKTDNDVLDLEDKPILTNIPGFGFISSVPLDYMHLILLRVMKRLISLWILGPLKVRLSAQQVNKISKMLLKLRLSTPSEFARRPRILEDFKYWKATEFRMFLLYTGPIVLKRILGPKVYSHFLLLHSAATILVNESHLHVQSNIDFADELLNKFVKEFPNVYEKRHVSQNVHNLLHICSDVKRFGSLDKFSAFRFENYMLPIKKMIRKGQSPLQQIARRYGELEKASIESMELSNTSSSESEIILQQEHMDEPLTNELDSNVHQFRILKTETMTINCNNSKDTCVLLCDGNFAVLKNIVKQKNGKICFVGRKYVPTDNLYNSPESRIFNIHYAQRQSSKDQLIVFEHILKKAGKVPREKGIIAIPMAHNP